MEEEYKALATLHGQNVHNASTRTSDTVTGWVNAGVTKTSHYFSQKWGVIFSLFEILGLSTDRHNKM